MTSIAKCRLDLKNYCLRKLGYPALQINVTAEQIEDRIDDALYKYWDWHHDGSNREFLIVTLTSDNITKRLIELDPGVYTVQRMVTGSLTANSNNLEYQSFLQSIGSSLTNQYGGIVNYTVSESYISLLDDFFNRGKPVHYSFDQGILRIDSDMSSFSVGDTILLEVYRFTDPVQYRKVWNNSWLKDYTTSLIKKQWGQNLIKYNGVQLPSGITMDGRSIYSDALAEIQELETKLQSEESEPLGIFMG